MGNIDLSEFGENQFLAQVALLIGGVLMVMMEIIQKWRQPGYAFNAFWLLALLVVFVAVMSGSMDQTCLLTAKAQVTDIEEVGENI